MQITLIIAGLIIFALAWCLVDCRQRIAHLSDLLEHQRQVYRADLRRERERATFAEQALAEREGGAAS